MWHTDIESNLSCINTFDKYKTSSYTCVANTRWKLRVRNVCGVSNLKPTLLRINSRTVWSAGVSRSLRSSIGWWTPRKTSWWWGLIFFIYLFRTPATGVFFFLSHLTPQVATDVIKEFAADGVKYLELRSTPREEKNTGKDAKIGNDLWWRWLSSECLTCVWSIF